MFGAVGDEADVGGAGEAEGALGLVEGEKGLELGGVAVEVAAVELVVGVDEGLFGVEAQRDDVLCVLVCEVEEVLCGLALLLHAVVLVAGVQVFLVVGQHDDQRHVEDLLQLLGEEEWYGVSQVHAATAGTSSGVEHECAIPLVCVQDLVEVPMRKEEASPHQSVCGLAGDFFEALEVGIGKRLDTEEIDQTLVVDCFCVSRLVHAA